MTDAAMPHLALGGARGVGMGGLSDVLIDYLAAAGVAGSTLV